MAEVEADAEVACDVAEDGGDADGAKQGFGVLLVQAVVEVAVQIVEVARVVHFCGGGFEQAAGLAALIGTAAAAVGGVAAGVFGGAGFGGGEGALGDFGIQVDELAQGAGEAADAQHRVRRGGGGGFGSGAFGLDLGVEALSHVHDDFGHAAEHGAVPIGCIRDFRGGLGRGGAGRLHERE